MVGSFIDAKELVRAKIREKIGTAAFVICSSGDFMDGVVGIVALLGTVPDGKIGRYFFFKEKKQYVNLSIDTDM